MDLYLALQFSSILHVFPPIHTHTIGIPFPNAHLNSCILLFVLLFYTNCTINLLLYNYSRFFVKPAVFFRIPFCGTIFAWNVNISKFPSPARRYGRCLAEPNRETSRFIQVLWYNVHAGREHLRVLLTGLKVWPEVGRAKTQNIPVGSKIMV